MCSLLNFPLIVYFLWLCHPSSPALNYLPFFIFSSGYKLLQMENVISGIKDSNLKLMLAFGIGFHHAGLMERDRKTVEELFVNQRIQVKTVQFISMLHFRISDTGPFHENNGTIKM